MATTDDNLSDGESLLRSLTTGLNKSYRLRDRLKALRRENGNLREEIEKLQENSPGPAQQGHDVVLEKLRLENQNLKAELSSANRASQPPGQVAHLFKQNAEKQAEIDSLKSKLRALQSQKRKWRLLHPDFSSPVVSSDEVDRIPSMAPASPIATSSTHTPTPEQDQSARKRHRTQSPAPKSPLREISLNLPNGNTDAQAQSKFRVRRRGSHGSHAIDTVAEDGEDHNAPKGPPEKGAVSPKLESSAHRRLHNLLSAPPPAVQFLSRPSSVSKESSVRPGLQFLPVKIAITTGPEDAEPFRSRPLNRQALSHFKLNPQYNDGLDFAFNETVRNQEARKCLAGCTKPGCCGDKFKAIAATLPRSAMGLSDHELLLEYLGQGSEAKIQGMTPLAKKNLVHEARAKKMANAFGKMHRGSSDRPKTPPEFWGVDVLGSQEERNSHQQANLLERGEVEKRYQEALKENGRWVFADE
ncbi:hypothetical protein LTR84_010156 [Exophiala bonariae]|uniref:DNA endonuclease activator Ctp1 C-terminal domain-containing protein n=1 Tax=Exophiala bonariae TaxID=1690606 RepID=A0AAV9MTS3_9EURO|nr:hypothetical protein LTR84_010156 [Exophiala bonariae]